ncbi:hypothetical protein FPOA_09028 [Fusarium poae]|uniref:MULE transposase domain-containing protein n=1 Tax=Fusarium poae TaxID=36050 RepID=A0A1B8AQN2_FUSPO|nr:hypothetical protein FPOA_09028 [Fusarium poae]
MVSTRRQSYNSESESFNTAEPPRKRARLSSQRVQLSRQHNFRPPLLTNPPPPYQRYPASRNNRWTSPTSSAPSVSDSYGFGDTDALDNIFAAVPDRFSTIPSPRRSGPESSFELQYNHAITLRNDFPRGTDRRNICQVPIPGPETDPFQGSPRSSLEVTRVPMVPEVEFQRALGLVRDIIGNERRITRQCLKFFDTVRSWRERWGYSPLNTDEYGSPPAYSPRESQHSSVPVPSSPNLIESSPSQQSESPPPDEIPNPPIPGNPAPTENALYKNIQLFAKEHGFGIAKYNKYSYKGRLIRYSIRCDRYGDPQPSRGSGLRQRKSRKCGCKWLVIAEALEEGKWFLRQHQDTEHHTHNHPPSEISSAHPSHRRLTSPVKATIESTSRRVGIRARDIRAIVEEQHPESIFTQRDIYNARALVSREKLAGYSPTAALLKLFDEQRVPYVVKWAPDEPGRLLGLVWTFPYCIRMWKRFPEVISLDNTYNTNRFKLPLFQVTGQTCLGTVFNAAFGLIDNERREGFQFLAESVSTLLSEHSIRQPAIIITDFDDSMKAALDDQFPGVQQQLCIHHVNSNVLLRSKQKWVKNPENSSSPDISEVDEPTEPQATLTLHDRALVSAESSSEVPHTYQGVLQMWKQVLFAETEEVHKKAWIALFRAQWARCFIRKYPNYGIRVTSGTEASNNNIKSYLLNGMSHLYKLVEAMQDMLHDQERDFKDACGNDEVLRDREFLGSSSDYLGELRSLASSKCLKLIKSQYRQARKALPTGKNPNPRPLDPCTDECSVSTELGIKPKKKLGIISMFGVGAFLTVVSTVRVPNVTKFAKTVNVTADTVDTMIWTMLEANVGMIVACMPGTRQFVRDMISRWKKGRSSDENNKGGVFIDRSLATIIMTRQQSSIETDNSFSSSIVNSNLWVGTDR